VISAFEGFVEDFLANTLYLQGHGLAQIAKKVSMNNPTVSFFSSKMTSELPGIKSKIGQGFELRVWHYGTVTGQPSTQTINWMEAEKRADGWMEVRHCLTHGLTSGIKSELWPAPLKGNNTAGSVLRKMPNGKHSIGLLGAISCARIYVYCAKHIADLTANELSAPIDFSRIPEFPLRSTPLTSN
jgi:hypothetical protein